MTSPRTIAWLIVAAMAVAFAVSLLFTQWREPVNGERVAGPTDEARRLLDKIHGGK